MKKICLFFGFALLGCSSPSSESGLENESNPINESEVQNSGSNVAEATVTLAAAPETEIKSEDIQEKFTSESSKIAHDFFQWYATAINSDIEEDYQPKFVADRNGMLSVDYSHYITNLRKYKFSETLIAQEVEKFETCAENVKDIKFAERDTKLSDLDDYIDKECDFFNIHRWIMDMEKHDGARILEETLKGDSSVVKIQPYNFNKDTNKFYYWEKTAKVTLKKKETGWEITNITI